MERKRVETVQEHELRRKTATMAPAGFYDQEQLPEVPRCVFVLLESVLGGCEVIEEIPKCFAFCRQEIEEYSYVGTE